MKRILFLILSVILTSHSAFSQADSIKLQQQRLEKIELIMRFQDLRSIHDGKLISFLSDRDSVVRERAVRAFGSIQDTGVIHLLVEKLFDRSFSVQLAAAFAVGQTAGLMSEVSRQALEHDLILARLDRTRVPDRVIEELGKFGTEQALRDLVSRFGGQYPPKHSIPLMMSIARFAIRGITMDEAVLYLLRFIKPADAAPWQAVYALQRIGDHKHIRYEIEHVVQLRKHPDPIVRIHLATLLGKIKDERTSLEPLQNLAEFDGDWRVRVSALRALGNFSLQGKSEVIRTFRRSFSHENLHIALTASSTFGSLELREDESNEELRESLELLRRMARNSDGHYVWQLQGEAAIALAKLTRASAAPFVMPTTWPQPRLQAQLLTALAYTETAEAKSLLLERASSTDPLLSRTALEGLQIMSRRRPRDTLVMQQTYEACLNGLARNDVAVVTTSATILGDTLFRRQTAVEPLLQALSRLSIPNDIEAIQEVVATLGKLRDDRAVRALMQHLGKPDRSIALASASALQSITGLDYSSRLPRMFEPLFTDFDFMFLRSLPDKVSMRIETIRGDIVLELYKNAAPFTVLNIVKLARRGFYRGLVFHRVVPNFVIQGGDPRGDGWGGPGYSMRSEFSKISFDEGSIGIASAGKDTEGSQFFITHSPQPHLDGRYTLFGKVVSGMDVVNKLQVGDRIFDVKVGR
jgi:cyclophilin family peptidyl-prolyl cis-trans isomerase/HEAT repeat protein